MDMIIFDENGEKVFTISQNLSFDTFSQRCSSNYS